MGRLVEQLGLNDREYCPLPLPDARLEHAEARDRKLHGRRYRGKPRFVLLLLEKALLTDIQTKVGDPTSRNRRGLMMERVFQELLVSGSEGHPGVIRQAKKLARRDLPRRQQWEHLFKPEWETVSINLRNVPEEVILASGQTCFASEDPFMARLFDHGASALKELARYLVGKPRADMTVYFAASPVKLDKTVKNPTPEYEMRKLEYKDRVRDEGVRNAEMRRVFQGVNRRGDAFMQVARIDVNEKPILSIAYLPHDLVTDLTPIISESARKAMRDLDIPERGLRPPKGELRIKWRANGVPFSQNQFPSLLMIDRVIQEHVLHLPDFIPATSEGPTRTTPRRSEMRGALRLLHAVFPNSSIFAS